MLKNIYGPAAGGVAQERKLEALANNMANINTRGYKADGTVFSALMPDYWDKYPNPNPPAPFKQDMSEIHPLRGNEIGYSAMSEMYTDFSPGSLEQTGNPMHFAIEGEGFFSIQTPHGVRYTRDGSFQMSSNGVLVDKQGHAVMGKQGAIVGLQGEEALKVLPSGDVYMGEKFLDKLHVVNFKDKSSLLKLGANRFYHEGSPDNVKVATPRIQQGAVEGSNVSAMRSMTDMIEAHRIYESLQKSVKSFDNMMQISASKIGEVT